VRKQHSGEALFLNWKGNVSRRALVAMKLVTQMPSSILVIKIRLLAFISPLAVGSIAAFFLYFRILPVAMVAVILIGMALPGDPPSHCLRKAGHPPSHGTFLFGGGARSHRPVDRFRGFNARAARLTEFTN
jgi:hypothetical protein